MWPDRRNPSLVVEEVMGRQGFVEHTRGRDGGPLPHGLLGIPRGFLPALPLAGGAEASPQRVIEREGPPAPRCDPAVATLA
jgi:hypothetical protein